MNIIAVIPARGGSKGIPNKNIRIVCGHPLIYYAIKNAKQSRYINKIIVTTDSPEVQIIAEQMGVSVHIRDKSLAKDDVTLDAVIFDAIQRYENIDYVITLQPTSPTLHHGTLDKAIEYSIESGVDTLISVINKPHLAWGIKNDKKVPLYKERKNRQYLPPHYLETGAFVISKRNIVSRETRIGQNVDVYEISEEEAVDVDSFSDLSVVKKILEKERIAIYVNGNNQRGMGHIYRSLELADEFDTKPDIFYDSNQTSREVFGNTTHTLIPVDGIVNLYEICRDKQYTIFINDILSTSIDYMIGLRSVLPKAKIINFEDDGEGSANADIVFNALYSKSNKPNIKAGEKYYIANKSFLFYSPIEIKDRVKKVFISFGGADPQCYTDRILKIIEDNRYDEYDFLVVIGRAKQNVDELLGFNRLPNVTVIHNTVNMAGLMSTCDVGITARGRTGYELAMLGIPSIAMAQNEREEKHDFVSNENGFTYIGLNPEDEIIKSSIEMYLGLSKASRERFQKMLLAHNLRVGRKNVMNTIKAL